MRNYIFNNLNSLKYRDIHGKLWENILILERRKLMLYKYIYPNDYFWLISPSAELNYVEDKDGSLDALEFEYGIKENKCPVIWTKTYH